MPGGSRAGRCLDGNPVRNARPDTRGGIRRPDIRHETRRGGYRRAEYARQRDTRVRAPRYPRDTHRGIRHGTHAPRLRFRLRPGPRPRGLQAEFRRIGQEGLLVGIVLSVAVIRGSCGGEQPTQPPPLPPPYAPSIIARLRRRAYEIARGHLWPFLYLRRRRKNASNSPDPRSLDLH